MPVTQPVLKRQESDKPKHHKHCIKLRPLAVQRELPRLNSGKIDVKPAFPLDVGSDPAAKYRHMDKYAEYFLKNRFPEKSVPPLVNQYLRPNAKYVGEQQSSVGIHDIRVELKSVDLVNLVVTGFFQILGLTDEHPLITTCFKGEIINNPLRSTAWRDKHQHIKDYAFITEHRDWGLFPQNDLDHWKTLIRASQPMSEPALKDSLLDIHSGRLDSQFVYMRWKEEFLLPDLRIKQLKNASFEGFYYVVLNIGGGPSDPETEGFSTRIIPGTVSGLYYHTQNDKFQLLSLRYVEERGTAGVYDFQ